MPNTLNAAVSSPRHLGRDVVFLSLCQKAADIFGLCCAVIVYLALYSPLFFLSNILVTAALFMPTALTVTSIEPLHSDLLRTADSVLRSVTARHLLLDTGIIM